MINFFLLLREGSVNRLFWQHWALPLENVSALGMPNANLLIGWTPVTAAPCPAWIHRDAASWGMANWDLLGPSVPSSVTPCSPVLSLSVTWDCAGWGKTCLWLPPLDGILLIPLHLLIQLFSCCPENKTEIKSSSCAWHLRQARAVFGFWFPFSLNRYKFVYKYIKIDIQNTHFRILSAAWGLCTSLSNIVNAPQCIPLCSVALDRILRAYSLWLLFTFL